MTNPGADFLSLDHPISDAELAIAVASAILDDRQNPGANLPFQVHANSLLARLGLDRGRGDDWRRRFGELNPAVTLEFRMAEYCWRLVGLGFLVPQMGSTWGVFHPTDRGRIFLSGFDATALTAGGLDHRLARLGFDVQDLTRQYGRLAQDCFLAGHYESSVVMLGVASEALVLDLASSLSAAQPLAMPAFTRSRPTPSTARQEMAWISEALTSHGRAIHQALQAKSADDSWVEALKDMLDGTGQAIRLTRNDYGHPTGIAADQGEALQLISLFPRFAEACTQALTALSHL